MGRVADNAGRSTVGQVLEYREPAEGKVTRGSRRSSIEILNDPHRNKGTAFTEAERDTLGLRGLLPPRVFTLEQQEARALENLRRKTSDLEKYIYLTGLLDRNETLFYRIVLDHIEELLPIIYTPTVGEACSRFGLIFRRARGLYVSSHDRGRVDELLAHWPERNVQVIVVTDGERILGLGDLGAQGMGIPIGKLSLYTACAGLHPAGCLPVMLDVGTNNEELLRDPLYIGLLERRLRGEVYDALVEEFVTAAERRFPGVLIQFEDFATDNAFRLLAKFRDRSCVFNDDIQGTAAVTLAGLQSAGRITGKPVAEQVILFYGAGAAATGIADLVSAAMRLEGLGEDEARRRCWFVDSKGLVVSSRTDLKPHKRPYAHDYRQIIELGEAIRAIRPSALIGVSGQPNAFTEPVIRAMASANERPIIFALSNPTSKSECSAEQAYGWTEGRAVFASGSPFGPVSLNGRKMIPGQANNSYIFPGVGLGVVVSGARRVTDEMFAVAARTLAAVTDQASLESGSVFPPLTGIRSYSHAIAVAVAEVAFRTGLTSRKKPKDLAGAVRAAMYEPTYPPTGG
ncbi:MAG: NAD-dependent malic enzyme [Gemmatimonadetes bacterium]|nr:NAD-dependent malic enzyme [Gemmatimonadota bacterium]